MRIAMVAARFSEAEVNELRSAMATFRRRGTIGLLEEKMVNAMVARGYDPEFAARCFKQIKGFGEYGFPESHAASFAHLVYVSAWLKCHHPAAFCAAILNSQPMGFYAPAQLVRDAREHGVEVRPPTCSCRIGMQRWNGPPPALWGRVGGERWGIPAPAVGVPPPLAMRRGAGPRPLPTRGGGCVPPCGWGCETDRWPQRGRSRKSWPRGTRISTSCVGGSGPAPRRTACREGPTRRGTSSANGARRESTPFRHCGEAWSTTSGGAQA